MKAITLHQPWASLIAEGIKTIETRSWKPPDNLIGERIAIHAGQRCAGYLELNNQTWKASVNLNMPKGAIVAAAILDGAYRVDHNRMDGIAICTSDHPMLSDGRGEFPVDPYGDFSLGRWLWILKDVQKIDPPIPAQGHQSFWNWTPDIRIRESDASS